MGGGVTYVAGDAEERERERGHADQPHDSLKAKIGAHGAEPAILLCAAGRLGQGPMAHELESVGGWRCGVGW